MLADPEGPSAPARPAGQPSGWLGNHKRSAFLFVVRESDRRVYFVRRNASLGAPGGKGEPCDFNDLAIAVREFAEETGALPPGIERRGAEYVADIAQGAFYSFVAAGDVHHVCSYFYRVVPDALCARLPVGASPEAAGGGEDEVLWVDVAASWGGIRPHIQRGINLIRRSNGAVLPPVRRGGPPWPNSQSLAKAGGPSSQRLANAGGPRPRAAGLAKLGAPGAISLRPILRTGQSPASALPPSG